MKLNKLISNKKQNRKNQREKLGITLFVLVITIILILILASAIIVTLSKTDPIDEAEEAVLKSDIQAIKDNYEIRYKDLLYDNLGDGTKIKDSDFDGVIPDRYEDYFTAGKDGIEYIGEDEKIKDIADEMGIGKEKGNNLENVIVIGDIDQVEVDVIVKEKDRVETYHYYIREKGTEEWKEYTSDKSNMIIDGLKEDTRYEVKVELVEKDGRKEESKIKDVITKGLNAAMLIMKENDKNGNDYVEGKWSKESIYVEIKGNHATYTATGANEVGKTDKPSVLENEGITKVTLETKVGSNIITKDYEIKIDKTAPEGSIVEKTELPRGMDDTDLIVKVNGTDQLSGVKEYEFYLDNQPMIVTKEKEYKYEKMKDGKHEIKVVIVDLAGNRKEIVEQVMVGIPDSSNIKVEKNPTKWTNGNVTLKLTYEPREVYTPQFSRDNNTWKDVNVVHEEVITENTKVYARYVYHGTSELTGTVKEITIDNIDKVLPQIISLTSSNTNATNQNITLTAKSKDPLSGIIAYQFSTNANLDANSSGWKTVSNTKSEMTQTFTVTTNGTYYFYVKDEAGNVAKKEIKITNIDKTPPTLTSIAVTSPATGTYKSGQNVTIVATYSENMKGTAPVLKIKFGTGTERTATAGAITNNQITYTYQIVSGDNGALESTSYTGNLTDIAGNNLTVANKALTGNSITADTTYPTGTAPTLASNTNSITATFQQTDTGSGINGATRQYAIKKTSDSAWGGWITSNSGSYTFSNLTMNTSYQVKTKVSDNVGNTTESSPATINTVNITKPTLSPSTTSWTRNNVTVTITYPNIAGTTRQYSTNGSSWSNASGTTQAVTVSSNNTTVYARIIDSTNQTSGNVTHKVTCIDKTVPSTTAPSVSVGSNYITVNFRQTDSGSGINGATRQYAIRNINGSWGGWVTSNSASYTFWNLGTNATYQVKTKVSDNAGNSSESGTANGTIAPPPHTCNTDNHCNQLHYPGYWWYNCTCGNAHDCYRHAMCSVCGKKSPVSWWYCPTYPMGNEVPCV